MALRHRFLVAGGFLVVLGFVGATILQLASLDPILEHCNEAIQGNQARFELFWTSPTIEKIVSVYPRIEQWRIIRSQQVSNQYTVSLACFENRKQPLRLLLWLNRDSRVVRYLWIAGGRTKSSVSFSLPPVLLGAPLSTVKRDIEPQFAQCGFAELYDVVKQGNRWEVRRGCFLKEQAGGKHIYFEPRLVQENDPRLSLFLWFFWETDGTGRIIDRGIHGSW